MSSKPRTIYNKGDIKVIVYFNVVVPNTNNHCIKVFFEDDWQLIILDHSNGFNLFHPTLKQSLDSRLTKTYEEVQKAINEKLGLSLI